MFRRRGRQAKTVATALIIETKLKVFQDQWGAYRIIFPNDGRISNTDLPLLKHPFRKCLIVLFTLDLSGHSCNRDMSIFFTPDM